MVNGNPPERGDGRVVARLPSRHTIVTNITCVKAGGRMKILVVDDHALFRAGLRLLLRAIRSDAQIMEASFIDEALAIAAREPEF